MARTIKTGLEYFPLDIDMFQDIRIRKLIKRKGGRAVTIYTLLLCIIYKNGYYIMWDEDLPFVISEQTGFEEEYIKEAFDDCVKLGLFDATTFKQHGAITSKGIQSRYKLICSQLKRKANIDEYSLISSEEKPISSELKPINSEETPISSELMQQKKRKEIKGKESKRKEKREREGESADSAHAPSPAPGLLSFEKFNVWMQQNTPEICQMRPPNEKQWNEVKCLYGTAQRLATACEEIAANDSFRKKWKYFHVALKKWHERELKLK